jgi:Cu(I)/Ag(I) efflux system membrane fusion protein
MELKPEMFVNDRVQTSRAGQQSVSVPRTALLWSGKRSIVYVKVADTDYPAYEMREVGIGPKMGDRYVIEEGLEPGEEIVTNGVFAIDAAAQLSGNYSMMMRPASKRIEVPESFRKQISEVAENYFDMKNALVESDPKKARSASKNMLNAIGKVEMQSLDNKAHDRWMAQMTVMTDALKQLGNTDDLEKQRAHFSTISDSILEMAENFGLLRGSVYRHYCPMAFDNRGAYWLSEFEEIRNPYFGDEMMNCGEVKATYEEGKPVFEAPGRPTSRPDEGHRH